MPLDSTPQVSAQDQYCGISAQSAQNIATEVIRLSGHEYDSVSQAYYVSVLASRLSPYYVIYFFKDERVVGEMEVEILPIMKNCTIPLTVKNAMYGRNATKVRRLIDRPRAWMETLSIPSHT